MSTLTPSGRLSKVENGEKIFQIQTEFFQRPQPKIASTVILNGEIVNKIETPWEEELATDEDLKKIEKAIRKQHRQVIQIAENQKAKDDKIPPEKPPSKEPWEKLTEVQGIENLMVADAQGIVLFMNIDSPSRRALLKTLQPVIKLANFLSQSTRLGDFKGGQIKTEREKMAWIYQEDQLWIAFLNEYMDFDSFKDKVHKIELELKVE
jgi:hypothetical protein